MVNQSRIVNEENMDRVLNELGKGFNLSEAHYINKQGAIPFYKRLHEYYSQHRTSTDYEKQFAEENRHRSSPLPASKKGHHLVDTLTYDKQPDGSVGVGFSRVGKKAYIARFINDGWDASNQYHKGYRHVEGRHYWEKTESEVMEDVRRNELEALREVMKKRGL